MSNRVERALELLRQALRWSRRHGKTGRVKRIKAAQDDLTPAPRVIYPGVRAARDQSENGPRSAVGMCLQMVRTCYNIDPREADAISAWRTAEDKHRTTDPMKVPRGYPVFWSGGSAGHGHIAIAAGDGACWSTDIRRPGYFDRVPIDEIRTAWGLTLLGWTTDLNGEPVPAEEEKQRKP
jgi:hypothetical protein